MPNPTRQEILDAQLARQWAERNKTCEVSSPEIQAAANFILANTPAPTMAEVEWDNDKHYLAEAEHPGWGKVIMLGICEEKLIDVFIPHLRESNCIVPRGNLTPTGKRYELKEVQE